MAEQKITEAAVLALFRDEKITVSRGAQLLGIPIQDFMNLLYANGISLDDETPEEMEENLQNLQKLFKPHKKKTKVI
ncbi:MAG: UPF0175 family protein [Candidatus Poribacteria bacterium]|nr:UPF0175 family protein [Candidatus Poribacteria bacterium]